MTGIVANNTETPWYAGAWGVINTVAEQWSEHHYPDYVAPVAETSQLDTAVAEVENAQQSWFDNAQNRWIVVGGAVVGILALAVVLRR